MKVLINITEITTKLIEVEVPGGMDTETGLEWARDKVEQDYFDGEIDMTVDIDSQTEFDILNPSDNADEQYAETIRQLEEEADNKYC